MDDGRMRRGNLVIGAMLVLIGLWVTATRAGLIGYAGPWTLWPLILFGIGLARFVQSPAGGPWQGLLFLTGGAWLFAGEAGWVSVADSWPLLVIAFGLIVAFNAKGRAPWHDPDEPDGSASELRRSRRQRRHERSLTPLAVIGIWIAIVVAAQVSGVRSFPRFDSADASDGVRVVSVMGRSERTIREADFKTASLTNVMGRSELDLRGATIAPGAEASLEVFSLMGAVVVRVPPGWMVDTRALSALGTIQDDRFPPSGTDPAAAGPAPRLVLRGAVLMGRLAITS